MKKQRVLALLLALSLALGTNGVSVLAAGPEGPGVSVMVEDNDSPAGEETPGVQMPVGEAGQDGNGNAGQAAEDETEQPDGSEGEDKNRSEQPEDQAGNDQSDPEQPGDSAGDDQNDPEQPGDTVEDDQNDPEQPGDTVEDDQNDPEQPGDMTGDDQNDPENPDASEEEQNPDDDEVTDAISANDVPADEEEDTEKPGEEPAAYQSLAPRMMTFQDEVGMRITYDANAQYDYIVDETGTLTGITKVGGGKVEGNVVLDETKGIKRIGSGAFAGNTSITYIKMPAGLTTIGADAFKGCTALRGMTIPTGTTVIEESAFEGCSALTQFALPATIESIGNRAFYGDSRLFMVYMKSISISRLQSIGDYAFYECSALVEFCSDTEFTFPESLESIGAYAFYRCAAVKSIVFAENINTMGEHAFESCSGLRTITLPQALAAIPRYGFANCINIVSVKFNDFNVTRTIGGYAFQGCYNLGSIELYQADKIEQNAFIGCSGLVSVQIPIPNCNIEEGAFPDMETLYLIGLKGSNAYYYTVNKKIQFLDMMAKDENYYKCRTVIKGEGTVSLSLNKSVSPDDIKKNDPNKANNGKGVTAETPIYVSFSPFTDLVKGTLKCNGIEIEHDENNVYSFSMPRGGALITAEFEKKAGNTSIESTDFTYEFSNGADGSGNAELKVGQTTRLFLLDGNKNVIPTSKVTVSSDKPSVVKVTGNRTLDALKEGQATITMSVTGGDGRLIAHTASVSVSKADIVSLKLSADTKSFDSKIIHISEQTIGGQMVQTASMEATEVSKDAMTFRLKALAYDANLEEMSVALKWTSSDSRVAKLASISTGNAAATNIVTIPQGVSGESTITVSMTTADKKIISHKFIVQVTDKTPRLSATALTLNPNKTDGAVLRVIGAYGGVIDPATFKLVETVEVQGEKVEVPAERFRWEYDSVNSNGLVYYFKISPSSSAMDEKTYEVKASVNSNTIPTPIKITVKSSLPNPKVAFDKKQPKINLFYANDGTQVKPVITNLGNERVSRYELEPLSDDPDKDDGLFTDNFEIDPETGIITQKSDNMILTKNNKPITAGYLVLHFEGYKDNAVKKYKITIPTQTVKPSYKLDRTGDTYNSLPADRTITLTLLDTRTKKPVVWDEAEGEWTIRKSEKTTVDAVGRDSIGLTGDGQIVMHANGALDSGKVVLRLENDAWAEGKFLEYTYNIKATGAAPKIKLKTATVNLNSNYTEQTEKFYLISNQCDTQLADTQSFIPAPTGNNEDQFEYIHVDYAEGVGTVSVEEGIRPGSYKFKCEQVEGSVIGEHYNEVILTVKVVNTLPVMTVKGAPALNLSAESDGAYTETAELALNAKLPEGYEIDKWPTIDTIECTVKGMGDEEKEEVKESFHWDIMDNKLLISLNNRVSQKTYTFTMKPVYASAGNSVEGKAVTFTVRVYSATPSVKLSAKGVLNLVDRRGEYTLKNSIVYTPSFVNLKDTVEEARIFDADGVAVEPEDEESEYFRAEVLDGKIYVAPLEGVSLESKKAYPVKIWVRLANYKGYEGIMVRDILKVKTAQVLPKVTADRKDLNLYLSNKGYEATFRVTPKAGSVGSIADVVFGENDTKSQDSFEIRCGAPRADGSIDVYVKLKNTVSFAGGSSNKVTMYVVYEGQGTNTTGPAVTMNVKINK